VGAWLASIVSTAGCSPIVYECATDASCGASGRCEPIGYCSFPDDSCSSGRRFSNYGGDLGKQCVAPGSPPDDDPSGDIPAEDTAASEPVGTGGSDEPPDDDDDPVDPSTSSTRGDETTGGFEPRNSTGSSSSAGTGSGPPDVLGTTATSSSSVPPPPPSCAEIFGPLADPFEVCIETDTTCRFAAQTDGGSCETLCEAAGAVCEHAWNNLEGTNCEIESVAADDCTIGLTFQICECSRPGG
jgi:hypothetical protein